MRKITKLRRSIRAVSPVISVLLMIAIAVIASLVAYAWVMGYMGGRTEQTGNQIDIQSYKTGTNLIYVQNTGQGTVHLNPTSSVYINDVLKNIDLVDNKTLDDVVNSEGYIPIDAGQTRKLQINYIIQAGDKIKIVTVEGTWMEIPNANQGDQQTSQQNPTQYTITPSAGTGGSISPSTPQTVNAGSSVTFNIAANQGYHIRDVVVDSVSQGARTSYTFTNVQADHSIQATFEVDNAQVQYTITPSAGEGGSITPDAPQTVNAGGSVTFSIAANEGYHIADVLVDGASVGAVSSYPFTNVQANHVISATFEANPVIPTYTITSSADAGGSISPSGVQTVNAGGSVTFSIAASQDYHIDVVTVDASPVSLNAQNQYVFTNVQANHEIHATFAQNPPQYYSITFVMGAGGQSIMPAAGGGYSYPEGTPVQLGAIPDGTHLFQSWSTDNPTGITFDNANNPTATATINGNGIITANFVLANHKLVFVEGAPQNLETNTPSGKITLQRQTSAGTPILTGDTDITLSATAGTFYSDASCTNAITAPVTISSGSTIDFYYMCSTEGTPTLTAEATDYQDATTTFTITAQAPTTYTVTYTVNNDDYGTVDPSGTISNYEYGDQVTITATPKPGYVFKEWTRSGDINIADTSATETTATILGDGTITANFKAESTDKLAFIGGTVQYLNLNQASNVITVERQTQSGASITSGTTTIQLVSTSSGGKFYTDYACTIEISTVTITSGSTATFYYKDSSTGTPIISAIADDFATAQTYLNINTKCTGFETFPDKTWYYGFSVEQQPPWYRGIGQGVGGTDCAMSDSNDYYYDDNGQWHSGSNDGAFTANYLDTSAANTITITFQYKLVNTNSPTDFVIAYSTETSPDFGHRYSTPSWYNDFTYFETLGTTQNDGQWHTYSVTFTKAENPTVFTDHFWFRFESDLTTRPGNVVESVYADNVIIAVT